MNRSTNKVRLTVGALVLLVAGVVTLWRADTPLEVICGVAPAIVISAAALACMLLEFQTPGVLGDWSSTLLTGVFGGLRDLWVQRSVPARLLKTAVIAGLIGVIFQRFIRPHLTVKASVKQAN